MTKIHSPILDILLPRIAEEFSLNPPGIHEDRITSEDIQLLKDECGKESPFDPLNKRKYLLDRFLNRTAEYDCCSCPYGKIVAIWDREGQEKEIPWELWGRIFRIFTNGLTPPKNNSKNYFKVYFLANTNLREFPEEGNPIKPENINGGYTYPCNKQSIIIYRAEDATRVLIHELMHAVCADNHELGIDHVEAETEAWAELIYIVLLSQGKKYIFNSLLQRQSEYMRKQNKKIEEYIKGSDSDKPFPWRYTIGKQEVWKRWGILLYENSNPYILINKSLRLTYPPDIILKERFKVKDTSTIL
jgi:hypothetical protein